MIMTLKMIEMQTIFGDLDWNECHCQKCEWRLEGIYQEREITEIRTIMDSRGAHPWSR